MKSHRCVRSWLVNAKAQKQEQGGVKSCETPACDRPAWPCLPSTSRLPNWTETTKAAEEEVTGLHLA